MGYVEKSVSDARDRMRIDVEGCPIDRFDVDLFGLDDGHDEGEALSFRALFQLGAGYMIYLYVIGLRQPGQTPWFHTFWIKDCAVAEVEMEELGAPRAVECADLVLPPIYRRVVVASPSGERSFAVVGATFCATWPGALALSFGLATDGNAGHDCNGALCWRSDAGWWLYEEGGEPRQLALGERITFHDEA